MAWYSGRILEPASTFSNVGEEDMLLLASEEAHHLAKHWLEAAKNVATELLRAAKHLSHCGCVGRKHMVTHLLLGRKHVATVLFWSGPQNICHRVALGHNKKHVVTLVFARVTQGHTILCSRKTCGT